jgi:hypothetical protein
MRYLFFVILSVTASVAFARDGYDIALHELISPQNIESRALVSQLKKALLQGNLTVSLNSLLNEPTPPMEASTRDARRRDAIAAFLDGEADTPIAIDEMFDELKLRTKVQMQTSYVNGIENRFRGLPFRDTDLSRVILDIIKKYPRDEVLVFSKEPETNLKMMAVALDFVAFTALQDGVSAPFRKEIGEFILRGQAHLSIRMYLLEWMLTDMTNTLKSTKQVNRVAAEWLNDLATNFGQLEYPDIAKEGRRKLLDIHQKMIAKAKSRNMNLCDRLLAPSALTNNEPPAPPKEN